MAIWNVAAPTFFNLLETHASVTPLMSQRPIDDCFRPLEPRMKHDKAIALLKERIVPVVDTEEVNLTTAGGRVLARNAVASFEIPAHTNAAVDGYAFAFSDYDAEKGVDLPVVGRAAAGRPFEDTVKSGTAVRILTGAVLPGGVDTIAMQEDVLRTEADVIRVRIPGGLKAGANVRRAGEDVKTSETLFEAGHILRPQDLAALASAGIAAPLCFKRLRLGIVSTGDEVIAVGSRALDHGEVYDANSPMLSELTRLAGTETEYLGIWPDKPEEVEQRLKAAAERFDVILTTGGASRGEEDHISRVLERLGTRHFWQLDVKPGRPMMFGQIGNTVVVGLPGNPVAVFVCFLMYVFPLLRKLSGAQWFEPHRIRLPADFEVAKRKIGRREFWRGMMVPSDTGLRAGKFKRDGSGLISGLRAADGIIEVAEDVPHVQPGDMVQFIPFSEYGIPSR
ncbi:gephyrin-like molybdotransferase Glp [Filomicrobium sp.]|nr:gephyrin-like molybdotransferase Glp [Filomicrobium sp.]